MVKRVSGNTAQFLVELLAGLAVAAIVTLVGQIAGLLRKVNRTERKVDDIGRHVKKMGEDFRNSHERMNDGEWHHKRSSRV